MNGVLKRHLAMEAPKHRTADTACNVLEVRAQEGKPQANNSEEGVKCDGQRLTDPLGPAGLLRQAQDPAGIRSYSAR